MINSSDYLYPNWPAKQHIVACTTLRSSDPKCLEKELGIPTPIWLNQMHGARCVNLDEPSVQLEADASYTQKTNQVCIVRTADCLPLLICDPNGTQIAAVHAGWRGLKAGVIQATLAQFTGEKSALLVWLGPAIGPSAFEVGDEVYLDFIEQNIHNTNAFIQKQGRWYGNLYQLAKNILAQYGILNVYGGTYCTLSDPTRFYSYRHDNKCGRMATLIMRRDQHV